MENWREFLVESTISNALLAFMSSMANPSMAKQAKHKPMRPADVIALRDEELLRYIKIHNHMIDDDVLFDTIKQFVA